MKERAATNVLDVYKGLMLKAALSTPLRHVGGSRGKAPFIGKLDTGPI
jgi:hypothetical protein